MTDRFIESKEGSSRRERRKLEVRGRILDASFELFEQHGVDATTVAEICERADVAQKTFFNHFPAKRDVLREIAQYALGELLHDIEDARKQPASTRERIAYFFECLANNADQVGPMHRELLLEIVHVAHETGSEQEQARRLHDAFGSIIQEGLDTGDITDRHTPETLTQMLMGAFYVLMFNWANLEDFPLRIQALAAAEFLADSMTVSLTPDEESPA